MGARLYVIPGSHPSMSARLMLEHKGIRYRRTDLIPVVSKGVVRAALEAAEAWGDGEP